MVKRVTEVQASNTPSESDETDSEDEAGFGFGDPILDNPALNPPNSSPPKLDATSPSQTQDTQDPAAGAAIFDAPGDATSARKRKGKPTGRKKSSAPKPEWKREANVAETVPSISVSTSTAQSQPIPNQSAAVHNSWKMHDSGGFLRMMCTVTLIFLGILTLIVSTVSQSWGEISIPAQSDKPSRSVWFGLWSACGFSEDEMPLDASGSCPELSDSNSLLHNYGIRISNNGLELIEKTMDLIIASTCSALVAIMLSAASIFSTRKGIFFCAIAFQVITIIITSSATALFGTQLSKDFATDERGNSLDCAAKQGMYFPLLSIGCFVASITLSVLRARRGFDQPLLGMSTNLPIYALVAIHFFLAGLASIGSPNFFGYNIVVFPVVLWAVMERSAAFFEPSMVVLCASIAMDIATIAIVGHQIMFAGVIAQRLTVVLSGINAALKPATMFLLYRQNRKIAERSLTEDPVVVDSTPLLVRPNTRQNEAAALQSLVPTSYGTSPYVAARTKELAKYTSAPPTKKPRPWPWSKSKKETPAPVIPYSPPKPYPKDPILTVPYARPEPYLKTETTVGTSQAKQDPATSSSSEDEATPSSSEVTHDTVAARKKVVTANMTTNETPALQKADGYVHSKNNKTSSSPPPRALVKGGIIADDGENVKSSPPPRAPIKGGIIADDEEDAKAIFETKDDDVFGAPALKLVGKNSRGNKKADRAARREAKRKEEEEERKREQAALEAEQARMEVQRFFAEEEARKELQAAKDREIRELMLLQSAKGGGVGARTAPLETMTGAIRKSTRSRSGSTERISKGTRTRSLSRERGHKGKTLHKSTSNTDLTALSSGSRSRSGSASGSRSRSGSASRSRSGSLTRTNSLRDLRHTSATADDSEGVEYAGKYFADAISAEVYKRSMENLSHN